MTLLKAAAALGSPAFTPVALAVDEYLEDLWRQLSNRPEMGGRLHTHGLAFEATGLG
jgi:hypothetical protein